MPQEEDIIHKLIRLSTKENYKKSDYLERIKYKTHPWNNRLCKFLGQKGKEDA